MASSRFKMPDGSIQRFDVPDGLSPAEEERYVEAQVARTPSQGPDPSEGGLPFRPLGIDTGMTMPQGLSRFMAGSGKALTDIGRGAGQIVGAGPTRAEADVISKQDAPLMNTGAGVAGNIATDVLATLPTLAVPGVNTYKGAALLGGAMNALRPVGEKDSRTANVATGAAFGTVGQAGGNAFARMARPVQTTLNPEQARLAAVAERANIPLDAADLTGSKPLRTLNSVFSNLPFTAGPEAERQAAKARAFNQAALAKTGIGADLSTPQRLAERKGLLGKVFEDVAERNQVRLFKPAEQHASQVSDWQAIERAAPADRGVAGKLDELARFSEGKLDPDAAARISDKVNKILSQTNEQGFMSGANLQAWREPLRAEALKGGAEGRMHGKIRDILDKAFVDQLTGVDAKIWKSANRQYANLKTIIDAQSGNAPNVVSGNIAPAQLLMALGRSVGKEGKALGRGDMNDLARAGNLFVRDTVPDSGTAQRLMWQSLLTGGGAGAGAAAAGMTGHDPMTGALVGAGSTAVGLGLPRLAQSAINSDLLQNYFTHQAYNPTAKSIQELMQGSGRTAGALYPTAARGLLNLREE